MSNDIKSVYISRLFDYYGDLLSDKQKLLIDCYYNQDFSLSEIAENEGITRQGVSDALKRAEAILFSCEEKLGICQKFDDLKTLSNKTNDEKSFKTLIDYINNL